MPNNSSARQKKQSKKEKTVPPPLHKEDKANKADAIIKDSASQDTSTLPLSFVGRDKASTVDRNSIDEANQEGSSLSLIGTREAANIAVPNCSDSALLLEFSRSLTDYEKWDIQEEIRRANPGKTTKELMAIKRALMLRKALEAWRKEIQDAKDSPLSLLSPAGSASKGDHSMDAGSKDASLSLLNLGTLKAVTPLSLRAQPKDPSQDAKTYARLSLTKEERAPVFAATKLANPDANREAFDLAYRIALWKADSQKRGINPGSNLDAVDVSLSSDTDSEDGSGEDADSSEDGMQAIRNDLLRQKQVSPSTSPKENEYLTGFMRSPAKPQPHIKAKQALDKEPFSLITPTKQAGSVSLDAKQIQRAGDVSRHGGSMSAQHGSLPPSSLHDAHLADRQSAADAWPM
jgi:hypothetical protein